MCRGLGWSIPLKMDLADPSNPHRWSPTRGLCLRAHVPTLPQLYFCRRGRTLGSELMPLGKVALRKLPEEVMGQQLVKEATGNQPVLPLTSSVPVSLLSVAFVLLWSTGYPAARIALDHSGPFTLLMLRFGGAGLIFAMLAGLKQVAWPRGRAALHSALVGALQLGLQF